MTSIPGRGPAPNRLHPYEAGWLSLLVQMRIATEREARQAVRRVAQDAIDDAEARMGRGSARRKRRRSDDE
jgi:Flp pilus assembly protein TadD